MNSRKIVELMQEIYFLKSYLERKKLEEVDRKIIQQVIERKEKEIKDIEV